MNSSSKVVQVWPLLRQPSNSFGILLPPFQMITLFIQEPQSTPPVVFPLLGVAFRPLISPVSSEKPRLASGRPLKGTCLGEPSEKLLETGCFIWWSWIMTIMVVMMVMMIDDTPHWKPTHSEKHRDSFRCVSSWQHVFQSRSEIITKDIALHWDGCPGHFGHVLWAIPTNCSSQWWSRTSSP